MDILSPIWMDLVCLPEDAGGAHQEDEFESCHVDECARINAEFVKGVLQIGLCEAGPTDTVKLNYLHKFC